MPEIGGPAIFVEALSSYLKINGIPNQIITLANIDKPFIFKNGLFKFLYHDTTMIIPLTNAIFDKNLNIKKLLKSRESKFKNNFFFKNLNFKRVEKKRFPVIKLKPRINEFFSTPIIINAANEILVDQYLKKKIPFNSFYDHILNVMNDRNYKKYAIKIPKSINQIMTIDKWARETTFKKLDI